MDQLLPWYNQELAWLRHASVDFSNRFPNVAGQLGLHGAGCEDPHVERLIESFAFLTARISRQLDQESPRIVEPLINSLLPNWLAPVPAISILQCRLGQSGAMLSDGHRVPRGMSVLTEEVDGIPCEFRTTADIRLWPLDVRRAVIQSPPFTEDVPSGPAASQGCLLIELTSIGNQLPFSQFEGLSSLRFHLHGPESSVHSLYEAIFNDTIECVASIDNKHWTPITLETTGFSENDSVLPLDSNVPLALHTLREYFAYPRKFLFFEAGNLDLAIRASTSDSTRIVLAFHLRRRHRELERFVGRDTFLLGCAPVVNLFSKEAEPLRIDHRRESWTVLPDASFPNAYEIHSVNRVLLSEPNAETQLLPPAFGAGMAASSGGAGRFWSLSRHGPLHSTDAARPVSLSIVDRSFSPKTSQDATLAVSTTCLNGDLPGRLPFGEGRPFVELAIPGPIDSCRFLTPVSPVHRPGILRSTVGGLISLLSTSHLPLANDPLGQTALLNRLRVCESMVREQSRFPFNAITDFSSQGVSLRLSPTSSGNMHTGSVTGFASGTELTITVDEELFAGTGLFLFSTVLERFLALHTSINSFTSLVLETCQRGRIKTWQARTGHQRLI
jgi:type VI secretion system protein ImpG